VFVLYYVQRLVQTLAPRQDREKLMVQLSVTYKEASRINLKRIKNFGDSEREAFRFLRPPGTQEGQRLDGTFVLIDEVGSEVRREAFDEAQCLFVEIQIRGRTLMGLLVYYDSAGNSYFLMKDSLGHEMVPGQYVHIFCSDVNKCRAEVTLMVA